ncbi:MAG: hypothetical protein C0511_11055 [Hyphomicrobium sp.]|nr:hypothetical protein [Hyphomicrobium sp.]
MSLISDRTPHPVQNVNRIRIRAPGGFDAMSERKVAMAGMAASMNTPSGGHLAPSQSAPGSLAAKSRAAAGAIANMATIVPEDASKASPRRAVIDGRCGFII